MGTKTLDAPGVTGYTSLMVHPLGHLALWPDAVTFDLIPGTKRPAVSGWQKLRGHQAEGKSYGLVCGPGWFVLDVDDPASLDALEREFGDLPDTFTVRSPSGGMHLYFLGDAPSKANTVGPGLDTRGSGKGYVVGPGSDYPGNKNTPAGGEYEIDQDCAQELARAPDWLLARMEVPDESDGPTREAIGVPKTLDDLLKVAKGKQGTFAVFWREVCTGLLPDSLPSSGWSDFLARATLWLAGQGDWSEVLGQTVVEIMGPSLSLMHKHRLSLGQDLDHLSAQAIASLYDRGASKVRVEQQAKRLTAQAIAKAKEDTNAPPRILQYRNTFYLAHPTRGFIGPYVEKELWGAVRDRPLPAPHTMEIAKPTQHGFVRLTPQELFEIYGRGGHLAEVNLSICAEVATLKDFRLTLPSTNRPAIVAAYHPEIDHWLELIGGDTLRDWIAVSMDLEEACPALWFTGQPGVGKSLVVRGLAGLWGHSAAVSMENAMGQFNEALVKCPVVEGQERIPADSQGNPRLEDLKVLISDTARTIEQKGMPRVPVIGAIRVVLSSNNIDLLRGRRDITAEDAEALVARFIHLRVTDLDAAVYLNALDVQREWIDSGALSAHFLHLIQTRNPPKGQRFRLDAVPNGLDSALRTNPGGGFYVMRVAYEWILQTARAVREGAPLEANGKICWVDGGLRASASGIKAKLDHDRRSMNDRTLGEALRRVSSTQKSTRLADGSTPKLWAVETRYIAHWASNEGWGSVEELNEAIKVLDAAAVAG